MNFKIEKRKKNSLARAGVLETPHGKIETPAFVAVGTKATVKAVSTEQLKELGAQVVLANTYHLYLQPGAERIEKAGGLGKFMNWQGPTMTDSGGFQVFSLGAAFENKTSKIATGETSVDSPSLSNQARLVKIDEDGVTFRSHLDGSEHRLTPEKSIEIQQKIGADIIFAFDECTSPEAPYEYQKEAMMRTHRWAARSFAEHQLGSSTPKLQQMLFGIVQGGRFEDLRKESARAISRMDPARPDGLGRTGGFDGFGIGGSFEKKDIATAVRWVNEILPEEKPRHLLGIGEPEDLIAAIENGCDLFDCVAPTRMARNGTLYTKHGRINITNAKFADDFSPIQKNCGCYVCSPRPGGASFTRAYLAHLFRAKEILASTLASLHNLYFIIHLVKAARQKILDGK
ncbi:MAG: tRNA-guanine transglycosylase [Parcubacteria group bacterium Gr01-1014_73]|nr:MAG: tRNA-guanine transglycosylase [Parcubacteria group bacterium Gr01-1014_73]